MSSHRSPFRRGPRKLYAELARKSIESRIRRNIEVEAVLDLERVTALPLRKRETDAGYDVASCEKVSIRAGANARVATGLRLKCPPGYFFQIQDRSSLLTEGVAVEDHVFDATYTGEIFVYVHNGSGTVFHIRPGDRIAQLIFLPQIQVKFVKRDHFTLAPGDRGDAGYGSSGRGDPEPPSSVPPPI